MGFHRNSGKENSKLLEKLERMGLGDRLHVVLDYVKNNQIESDRHLDNMLSKLSDDRERMYVLEEALSLGRVKSMDYAVKASDYFTRVYGGDSYDTTQKREDRQTLASGLLKFLYGRNEGSSTELLRNMKSESLKKELLDRCIDKGLVNDRKSLEDALALSQKKQSYPFDNILMSEHIIKRAKAKGYTDIADKAFASANSALESDFKENTKYSDEIRNYRLEAVSLYLPKAGLNSAYGNNLEAAKLYIKAASLLSDEDGDLKIYAYRSAGDNYNKARLPEKAAECYKKSDYIRERGPVKYNVPLVNPSYDKYS
ncbi:MAG: hypothetical protein M1433_01940 [Candidatus Parvarchaeota archaeon]|nr:hypothetical protein [Candidatus Parvarchaeota archaeon]